MIKKILIFPGGMNRSIEYLEQCNREGIESVGASSLDYDVSSSRYKEWVKLPLVGADEFEANLLSVIERLDISGVFTPNLTVWSHLNDLLPKLAPSVKLVNASPMETELAPYRSALKAATAIKTSEVIGGPTSEKDLSTLEIAAIVRHSATIPGMCTDEKLAALCNLAPCWIQGDLIEIGSWWGKSAFILLRLAHIFDIGKLLCVDPWSDAHLVQSDPSGLVDTASAKLSADEALRVFEINLLPYALGRLNYLRLPSTDGAAVYGVNDSVTSDAFGSTQYTGRVSLLHIDGNHHLNAVSADLRAWGPFVMPGGWIVLDDYTWAHGDGPKVAGDNFLEKYASLIRTSFVAGGALFMQVSDAIPPAHPSGID